MHIWVIRPQWFKASWVPNWWAVICLNVIVRVHVTTIMMIAGGDVKNSLILSNIRRDSRFFVEIMWLYGAHSNENYTHWRFYALIHSKYWRNHGVLAIIIGGCVRFGKTQERHDKLIQTCTHAKVTDNNSPHFHVTPHVEDGRLIFIMGFPITVLSILYVFAYGLVSF